MPTKKIGFDFGYFRILIVDFTKKFVLDMCVFEDVAIAKVDVNEANEFRHTKSLQTLRLRTSTLMRDVMFDM